MELTFLGTRGEIEVVSRRHRQHSALLVCQKGARLMIDCGADWLHRLRAVAPSAIVLTHAHPDHAWGLRKGASCPVYATSPTLRLLRGFPVCDRRRMPLARTVSIGGLKLKAFAVQHSIRAPAVGYRVSGKAGSFFYLPDVAKLPNASKVLRGVDLYIGDGATIRRSMVRRNPGKFACDVIDDDVLSSLKAIRSLHGAGRPLGMCQPAHEARCGRRCSVRLAGR